MAIRYETSQWTWQGSDKAFAYQTAKRLDSALDQLWAQIYDMLAGSAMLDTKRAWVLRREYLDFAAQLRRDGLPRGSFRKATFFLRDSDKWLAPHVTFYQGR